MKLRPLHDWVVVRPGGEREKTAGGIFIPESAQEKPKQGTVVAVGDGREKEDKDQKVQPGKKPKKTFVKTVLKPGETIIYDKWAGQNIEIDGESLVLVKEDAVLGTVE